jgi:hypothetical protein
MERCPNCRACREEGATCRRCGLELHKLLQVEAAAERSTILGVAHLAGGRPEAATADLAAAQDLCRTPFAGLLLGFAALLAGQGWAGARHSPSSYRR